MAGNRKMGLRGRALRIAAAVGAALLLPYAVTLIWSGSLRGVTLQEEAAGGRRIYLDDAAFAAGGTEGAEMSGLLSGAPAAGGYVDAEEFLIGLVVREISPEYEEEALKAQAIIARTWLYRQMDGRNEIAASELFLNSGWTQGEGAAQQGKTSQNGAEVQQGKNLQNLTAIQQEVSAQMTAVVRDGTVVSGETVTSWDESRLTEYYEKARRAVEETAPLVICYDGKFIEPLYHAVSAGRTRAGDSACPYLQPVDSSEDLMAENFLTVTEWSAEAFEQLVTAYADDKLGYNANNITGYSTVYSSDTDSFADSGAGSAAGPESGSGRLAASLQLISRDDSGYVTEYQIGSHTYTGDEVREMLALPSAAFTLEEYAGRIRAVCQGRGHGLGLSQYGANRRALAGEKAEEILKYYYHHVTIEEAE